MEGRRVVAYDDGAAALKILESKRPYDLLLFDSELPHVSGLELVRRALAPAPSSHADHHTLGERRGAGGAACWRGRFPAEAAGSGPTGRDGHALTGRKEVKEGSRKRGILVRPRLAYLDSLDPIPLYPFRNSAHGPVLFRSKTSACPRTR